MDLNSDLQTPYTGIVSRSFTPGNGVKIYGMVSAEAVRFTVNLQCSAEIDTLSDIALQIAANIPKANVVINSMRRGIWDEAQKITGVAIKCGERFVLGITCDFTQYKISINDQHICEIPQRLSYDRITHLTIDGDIILERISYEMEPTAPTFQTETLKTNAPAPFTEGPPPPYSEVGKIYPSNSMNYGACPLPMSSGMSSYPATATFTPAIPGQKSYPTQEIYPYASNSSIPLNAASSNFRPVPPSNRKKYFAYGCCIFFAVIILLAGLLSKSSRNHHHHHYRVDHGDDKDY